MRKSFSVATESFNERERERDRKVEKLEIERVSASSKVAFGLTGESYADRRQRGACLANGCSWLSEREGIL